MTSEVRFRDFCRAWLLGDNDAADDLQARLPDTEYQESDELVSAAFCVAVEHRFKTDPGPAAIRTFMDEVRVNFEDAQPPLKLLIAEALVRGALGEEHLIDEVDPNDFTPTQMPLTRKIVAESPDLQAASTICWTTPRRSPHTGRVRADVPHAPSYPAECGAIGCLRTT